MTLKNLYITKFLLFLPSLKAKNLKENPTPKEIQFFHKISSQDFPQKTSSTVCMLLIFLGQFLIIIM